MGVMPFISQWVSLCGLCNKPIPGSRFKSKTHSSYTDWHRVPSEHKPHSERMHRQDYACKDTSSPSAQQPIARLCGPTVHNDRAIREEKGQKIGEH